MWVIEVPSSGYNFFTPYPINQEVLPVVYSDKHNYLCWFLYHIYCSAGSDNNYLHWYFFLVLLTNPYFQGFPLPIPRHNFSFYYFYLCRPIFYQICVLVIHCDGLDYTFLVGHSLSIHMSGNTLIVYILTEWRYAAGNMCE